MQALVRQRSREHAAFVAIGSLSEAPLGLRDSVLADVASFDAFLLSYTAREGSTDNHAYFASWTARLGEHDWHEVEIPHLAKAMWYLFGRRSSWGA